MQKPIPNVALQKEVAAWYGVSLHSVRNWLKDLDIGRIARYGLTRRQLLILFDEFGPPDCFTEAYESIERNAA